MDCLKFLNGYCWRDMRLVYKNSRHVKNNYYIRIENWLMVFIYLIDVDDGGR